MAKHSLKTWPESFEPIVAGQKTADFRKDDRRYNVGDTLRLREWSPETSYTKRVVEVKVTHILRGPDFGVPEGYVMMSFSFDTEARPEPVVDYLAETWDMFKIFCEGRGLNPDELDATMRDRMKKGAKK